MPKSDNVKTVRLNEKQMKAYHNDKTFTLKPLWRIDQHLLYIGPVPARTGRHNGYRNRSNEVGGAAQPPLPSTPFR